MLAAVNTLLAVVSEPLDVPGSCESTCSCPVSSAANAVDGSIVSIMEPANTADNNLFFMLPFLLT